MKLLYTLGTSLSVALARLVSIGMPVLALAGCTSGQDIINPPPSDSLDKGNPKLDSASNQLILAEKRGEANSFAQQSNIRLVDGSGSIIIECVPGYLEAAAL